MELRPDETQHAGRRRLILITSNHAIFEGNGCQEEYPIIHTFPAVVCYDDGSNGFGDAISGQDTNLDSHLLPTTIKRSLQHEGRLYRAAYLGKATLTVINSVSRDLQHGPAMEVGIGCRAPTPLSLRTTSR